MTNAMLFEGKDLEEVLSEARLCFGPDVEIEAANRVRKGGVMGFFATEWYEVWARPAEQTANAAVALLERQDVLGDTEPDSFQSMVRNALADQRTSGPPAGPTGFDSAMDQFFGGPGGGDDGPAEPVLASAGAGDTEVGTAPAATAVLTRARTETAPAARETARNLAEKVADRVVDPAAETDEAAETVPTTSAAVALEDAPRGASVFETARKPRTELLWAMLDRLDATPKAPALPASGVVAFVGDAAASLEIVQEIGRRNDLWASDVAVVSRAAELDGVPSWLLISDFEELSSRAARWHQRDGIVPLIIDQSIEAADRSWAAGALVTLDPTQVRLLADAWRLPEEVGRFAAKLGGVDALELISVSDSVEPLAMLDLDIPMSTIEGRAATPELLAAVWLENRRHA